MSRSGRLQPTSETVRTAILSASTLPSTGGLTCHGLTKRSTSRRRRRVQRGAGQVLPARRELLRELQLLLVDLLSRAQAQLVPGLVKVNQQHVLHVGHSISKSNGACTDRHAGR